MLTSAMHTHFVHAELLLFSPFVVENLYMFCCFKDVLLLSVKITKYVVILKY